VKRAMVVASSLAENILRRIQMNNRECVEIGWVIYCIFVGPTEHKTAQKWVVQHQVPKYHSPDLISFRCPWTETLHSCTALALTRCPTLYRSFGMNQKVYLS